MQRILTYMDKPPDELTKMLENQWRVVGSPVAVATKQDYDGKSHCYVTVVLESRW